MPYRSLPYTIVQQPAMRRRRRPVMLFVILALIAIGFSVVRASLPRETRYEELARDVSVVIKANRPDMLARYVLTITPPVISRDALAQLSAKIAPFGRITAVKEFSSENPVAHRDFLVTFEHGAMLEDMAITSGMRIARFRASTTIKH